MARLPNVGSDADQWGALLNEFLLVSHNQDGTLKIHQGKVDVQQFGAKGDGLHDDTTAIQAAIDALMNSGGIVIFGPGIYRVGTLICRSNVSFEFTSGTIIKAQDGLNGDIFHVNEVSNIKFIGNGGTIQGLRANNQQINIAIRGASDIWIEDLTTKDADLDGIYISNGDSGANAPKCERVFVRNVISDNNRRLGLSIVSGESIIVEGCVFSNTRGTAPEWGVDIEPDAPYHTVKGIILRNCIADANANAGFGIYGGTLTTPLEVDILLDGCIAKNSDGIGINVYGFRSSFTGKVQIVNCTCTNNKDYGFWISNKHYLSALIEIRNLNLSNNATNAFETLGEARLGKGNGLSLDTQYIIYHNNSADFVPCGKVLIDGLTIIDNVRDRNPLIVHLSGGEPWTNIRAADIEHFNTIGNINKVPFLTEGTTDSILEFRKPQTLARTSNLTLTARHHNILWDNTGASTPVIFTLPGVTTIPDAYTFKIRMTAAQTVRIAPTANDTIYPFFPTTTVGDGKYIESNVIGSFIELRRLDDSGWFVVTKEGSWLSEGL